MFPADVFNGWEELGSRRGFRSLREVEAADDSYDILRAIKVQGHGPALVEEIVSAP